MTRAHKTDNSQAEIVETLRRLRCVVVDTSGHGEGFPDLVVIYPDGRVLLVECKSLGGVRFTRPELRFMISVVPESCRVLMDAEQAVCFVESLRVE
jgi:Holliday junction resolvase